MRRTNARTGEERLKNSIGSSLKRGWRMNRDSLRQHPGALRGRSPVGHLPGNPAARRIGKKDPADRPGIDGTVRHSRLTGATLPEVLTAIEFCIGTHAAFVLGEDYPLRVLDLDHCIDPRREPDPAGSADRLSRCEGTYIEKSVSGHGCIS